MPASPALVVVTSELTSLFLPTPQDTRSAKNDLCESGLWLEWMLIHWKKLKSYQWLEDRKLRLNVSGRRGGIELQIASEDLHTAELLLAENLTEEDASNYG
jgi:hypothetical protein